jgi:hypothetical protein
LGFYSASSLKQLFAGRRVAQLGHIIEIPNPNQSLILFLNPAYLHMQMYSIWFDPTRDRTNDLPHSKTPLHHRCSLCWTSTKRVSPARQKMYFASFLNDMKIIFCTSHLTIIQHSLLGVYFVWGHRGRDRWVVGFTTTHAISAYHHYNVVSSNHAQARCTPF